MTIGLTKVLSLNDHRFTPECYVWGKLERKTYSTANGVKHYAFPIQSTINLKLKKRNVYLMIKHPPKGIS